MKATLKDGTQIECTVQEFVELKQQGLINSNGKEEKSETKVVVVKEKEVVRKRAKRSIPTRGEYKRVMDLAKRTNLSIKQCIITVLNRQPSGHDYKHLRKHFGKKLIEDMKYRRPKKKFWKPKGAKTPKEVSAAKSERGKYIATRAWELIHKGVESPKAWKQASDEWKAKKPMIRSSPIKPQTFDEHRTKVAKGKTKEFKVAEFPTIWPLHRDALPVFRDMLKDIVANGGKIGYFQCKDHLQIGVEGLEWDGRLWAKFTAQVLANKTKICDYFMCKPKNLTVIIENGYHYIRYKK